LRSFLRRRHPWELAGGEEHPDELVAAAERRLAFLERDYGFDRDDHLARLNDVGARHPDVGRVDDVVLAYRRGPEVLKVVRNVSPSKDEAVFLDWFPAVMPQASYTYSAFFEEGTAKDYDGELARMASELLPDLNTATRLWRDRGE
jgi:hypothetical protein